MENDPMIQDDRPIFKGFLVDSFTYSTIRWLKRYFHCYSRWCSLICIPYWIMILPFAIIMDLIIFLLLLIVFPLIWICSLIIYPFSILFQGEGKKATLWNYALSHASMGMQNFFYISRACWWCYCGTGEDHAGVPIFCLYFCSKSCQNRCHRATQIEIPDQFCILL